MYNLPPPNIIDYIALVIIGIGLLKGIIRGLSGELAQFIGIIISFISGLTMYRPIGKWLSTNTRLEENSALALAFISTIIIAMIIMIILRAILKKIFELAVNPSLDKIGGAIAGTIKSICILLIIFWFMNLIPHEYLNKKFGEESIAGTILKPIIHYFTREKTSDNNSENIELKL